MSRLNDQEWWEAQFDQETAADSLRAAGLPFNHWRNNKPLFDGPVDWEEVEAICLACPVKEPEPDPEPEVSTSEPEAKPKGKGKKR